jgi:hypothetical protein
MMICQSCGNKNPETAHFCDECGAQLRKAPAVPEVVVAVDAGAGVIDAPDFAANSTNSGISSVEPLRTKHEPDGDDKLGKQGHHAVLLIERGEAASTEFHLAAEESYIGRWDADNGIFPDVDLDIYDPDAKVSRRHARIIRRSGTYFIEDLGSTNGTFINRGRRLLPGVPQDLKEGDEIIVGKTFLRFRII